MQHRQGEGPGVEDDVFEEGVRRLGSHEGKLAPLAETNPPDMVER